MLQSLSFGTFSVRNNSEVSTVLIRRSGGPVVTGGARTVAILEPGQPGHYRFDGLPAFIDVEVMVVTLQNLSFGGQEFGERLILGDFTLGEVRADALGVAEFWLGASLRTSGTDEPYFEGPYIGSFEIKIRYWSPDDRLFVERDYGFEVLAELKSSVELEILQNLSFGSVSAFASTGGVASLTLSPTGSVSSSNPPGGGAKIVYLDGAQTGRVRVSGAAPYLSLNVTFEPAELLLESASGFDGARFTVRDFRQRPFSEGLKADANGNAEFSVGATLETELSDKLYVDAVYRGTVVISVDY